MIGTGNYHLDWVHADDVASAHVLAEKALREKPDIINGQIYNVRSSVVLKIIVSNEMMVMIVIVSGNQPHHIDHASCQIGASFGKNDRPVMTHGEFVGLGDPSTKDHWGLPRPICLPILLIQILALLNEVYIISISCGSSNVSSRIRNGRKSDNSSSRSSRSNVGRRSCCWC